MTLTRVNKFFRKVGEFEIRYRWFVLSALLLFTIFSFLGLSRLRLESSNSGWFDDDDQIEIVQKKFDETFGNSNTLGILVESKDVFQPEVLKMIHDLGEELLLNVPYAKELTSLAELELSIGTEEGMTIINPFGDGIPTDLAEIEKIRNQILSRKSIVNKLVSRDCTETWISLSFFEYPEEKDWIKIDNKLIDPLYETGEVAIDIVTNPKWQSDLYTIKAAGMPYTETEEKAFMGKEVGKIVGLGFLVMVILLLIFLRSFRGVLVPVGTTSIGILSVFGLMSWFGVGVQLAMVFFPIVLGMALAVGYSVHLVHSFQKLFKSGVERKEAVVSSVEKTGWSLLFTVLTTMGSMISFTFINMTPVRWMGWTCTTVVLFVFLYTFILIPILFSFGSQTYKNRKTSALKVAKRENHFIRFGQFILNKKAWVLVLTLITIIAFFPGIFLIDINMDNFTMMGTKIPYMNRVYSITHSKIGSYLSYNMVVSFDEVDAAKDPEVLKKFNKLIDRAGNFELTKQVEGVSKVFSILDIIKEMNQTMHSDDSAYYAIPESRDLVTQLLFLYEISGGSKASSWVDSDYSILRAQVEISKFDAKSLADNLKELEAYGKELFPEATTIIAGGAVRFADMNSRIVWAELKSFFIALCLILILLALVFASARTGLIGLIPNLAPVLILGGLMGYLHFNLDMMTMMIMPMLLGIAVDDTIHFVNRIKYEFEQCGEYRKAIINSFSAIGGTLSMTTIILSLSFGVYMFSLMGGFQRVGILAPIGFLVALLADYTITPVLILITHPFGKEGENKKIDTRKGEK